jgi:hypothetical protein
MRTSLAEVDSCALHVGQLRSNTQAVRISVAARAQDNNYSYMRVSDDLIRSSCHRATRMLQLQTRQQKQCTRPDSLPAQAYLTLPSLLHASTPDKRSTAGAAASDCCATTCVRVSARQKA